MPTDVATHTLPVKVLTSSINCSNHRQENIRNKEDLKNINKLEIEIDKSI